MPEDQYRHQVKRLCQKISNDRLIIQGAGGNVSWKAEDRLWIKLSGTWISETQDQDIFGSIKLKKLRSLISQDKFVVDPMLMDQENVRPSIEVMLHAIINKRFVFHLHMVEVVAELINNSSRLIDRLKEHHLNAEIISYYKPGKELAFAVHQALTKNPECSILCLMNHGVVLFSDDINEIESQIKFLQKICYKEVFITDKSSKSNVSKSIKDSNYNLLISSQINALAFKNDIFCQLVKLWPICPDHLVFLGPKPYLYENINLFQQALVEPFKPILVFIKNQGIYFNKEIFTKIHLIQLQCFADILLRLDHYDNVPVIPMDEIEKLLKWDAEKYRQQMNH